MKNIKHKISVLFCFCVFSIAFSQSPLHYTYNGHVDVKQGVNLAKLKNPFTGGFELPQFSPIDLNLDGIPDLLVFDRGTRLFYTFINDGIANTVSYTYAPQYQNKFPDCNSFCLTYDYNNDGKLDLFMEASGTIYQYRNISLSTLEFAKPDTLLDFLGTNIFCPSTNIPSFNDIDNDGDMDILTWDPLGYTIQLYKNWRVEKGMTTNEWQYKMVDECWGKFLLDYAIHLGFRCKGLVYWPNGDDYTPPTTPGGTEAHSGSTLLTLDTDSDGDYEALLGDIFYNYLYFLKNGKKDFNYPKDTMIAKDSLYPSVAQRMEVMNFPAAYFLDVDNDKKRDIIIAPNDASGASKNKGQIYFYKNIGTDRKPIFNLVQKDFLSEGSIEWGGATSPTFVDIDNDGDDDLFIATHGEATATLNSRDFIVYYKNVGNVANPIFELIDTNFLFLSIKGWSGIKPCFGDLNGDGKKDLLLGESNGLLKYFINTSVGSSLSFFENTTQFSSFVGRNYAAPFLVDYNRDGKQDLFLGNYDGTISYYNNTGTFSAPQFTKAVDSVGKICLRGVDEFRTFYGDGFSVPIIADLNNDGKFDLIAGGRNGLYLYMNIENKLNDSLKLQDTVVRFGFSQTSIKKATGLYASPAIAQLDSDSVYFDLMLGNNGGGLSLFGTYEFKDRKGINDLTKVYSRLIILPNPAQNTISISNLNLQPSTLTIYDVTGKKILEKSVVEFEKETVDISHFQQGVYVVTIMAKDGSHVNGKFIKL